MAIKKGPRKAVLPPYSKGGGDDYPVFVRRMATVGSTNPEDFGFTLLPGSVALTAPELTLTNNPALPQCGLQITLDNTLGVTPISLAFYRALEPTVPTALEIAWYTPANIAPYGTSYCRYFIGKLTDGLHNPLNSQVGVGMTLCAWSLINHYGQVGTAIVTAGTGSGNNGQSGVIGWTGTGTNETFMESVKSKTTEKAYVSTTPPLSILGTFNPGWADPVSIIEITAPAGKIAKFYLQEIRIAQTSEGVQELLGAAVGKMYPY